MAAISKADEEVYSQFRRQPVSSTNGLGDKNTFLKILTAQLKYQDPMEGTDNTQFVAQMAQFTALEQMQQLNTSFGAMMGKQDILTGSMWIGKDAMVMGYSDTEPVAGKVQGFAIDPDLGLVLAVNGKYYTLDQVLAVKDPSEPWGSGTTPDAGTTTGSDKPTDTDKPADPKTDPPNSEGA